METLADRIARDGPVNELDAVGWAIRLAKRLEALHALGVAHGSVSPACVVTCGVERTAKAYLADVQLTTSMPPFQSPERIAGGDLSPADDTWAVAATLYTALTGKSPFEGATEAEVRQKILTASPPPLAVYDIGDDDLQHIIDQAFAHERSARTVTVSALRRALEEWHPDPSVGALLPLDDEESSFDADEPEEKTVARPRLMLSKGRPNAVATHMRAGARVTPSGLGPGRAPSPRVVQIAAPAIAILTHDDDEDDARTLMRGPRTGAGLRGASPGGREPSAGGFPPAPGPPQGRSPAEAGNERQLATPVGNALPPPAIIDPMRPFGPPSAPFSSSSASSGALLSAAGGGAHPIVAPAELGNAGFGRSRSSRGVLLAALLALLVAATLTFAFLRYGTHGLLG